MEREIGSESRLREELLAKLNSGENVFVTSWPRDHSWMSKRNGTWVHNILTTTSAGRESVQRVVQVPITVFAERIPILPDESSNGVLSGDSYSVAPIRNGDNGVSGVLLIRELKPCEASQ